MHQSQVAILYPFTMSWNKLIEGGYPCQQALTWGFPTTKKMSDALTASQNPKAVWTLKEDDVPRWIHRHLKGDDAPLGQ